LDYETLFKLLHYPTPRSENGIIQKLVAENCLVENIETPSSYYITNLGAILLAKDLHKFEHLSHKAMRVIVYKGKNKLNTLKEQVGSKGYAVGFEGLINYINDLVPANEEIGKAFRQKVKVYPEIAIRELVANALIHQDFSITGVTPMIEIYEDRIEISNPGKPLIDPLRFLDHNPRSRNEKLAYFMRRANICEERGSGIDKVVNSAEAYQLPAPNFISEDYYMRIILYAKKTWRQMTKEDKTRACYQHCSLKFVSNDVMTNQSLRQRFDIDEKNYPMISRVIADTIKEKLIRNLEPGAKKYIPFWA
jgi:ATP-dependent DNA helicase RecG